MKPRNVVADDDSVATSSLNYEASTALNRQTAFNKETVSRSTRCGCFHCGSMFAGSKVTAWLHEEDGNDSALCPYCGDDTVIVGTTNHPLSTSLLSKLYKDWFSKEFKARKASATHVPFFRGFEDYDRKGIPFLLDEPDTVEVLGAIDLFWDNLSVPYEESGVADSGGMVAIRAARDQGCFFSVEFIDELGRNIPCAPLGEADRELLRELITTYGDRLRGVIPGPQPTSILIIHERSGNVASSTHSIDA